MTNKTWLYEESKVSVIQANVHLAQKGECWTWKQKTPNGYINHKEWAIIYKLHKKRFRNFSTKNELTFQKEFEVNLWS